MAQISNTFVADFVDKRRVRGEPGTSGLTEKANYANATDLRTRLTAISAGTFTAARLDAMTQNDMVYALRMVTADVAGVF